MPSTQDSSREERQQERLRLVERAVKSVDTGKVTIHISDRQIRRVDVTQAMKPEE